MSVPERRDVFTIPVSFCTSAHRNIFCCIFHAGHTLKRWKRRASEAKVRVGDKEVPFNKEATRWLGVWLDSHLTLRTHTLSG